MFQQLPICLLSVISSLLFTIHSPAKGTVRNWTNNKGQVTTAEITDSDGKNVTLIIRGKSYDIPVNDLSKADQEWIKKWKTDREKRFKSLLGLRDKVQIHTRFGNRVDDYFQGPFGNKQRKFYDTVASISDVTKRKVFMNCTDSVAWKDATMVVYCPKSYKGSSTPMGILINISPGDNPLHPKPGYEKIMDEHNIIYASPTGTSNKQSDMRRAAIVLDVLATLRADYRIDDDRIFVGGVSGGGAMSSWMSVYYPEFRASLNQCRNEYIPSQTCFPTIDEGDLNSIRKRKQAFIFITGSKDSNRKHIIKSIPDWEQKQFIVKLYDVPGMGHTMAPAKELGDALKWAEESSQPPLTR